MRRRVPEREEWLEVLQRGLRDLALDALRLVEDNNRIRMADDVNRFASVELVLTREDRPRLLAAPCRVRLLRVERDRERLRVDDHHLNAAVTGKGIDLLQPRRIVDEEVDLALVDSGEVFLRDLKGLVHALADGDRRHDDDELHPSVPLVEFVDGLDVGVGFADARLHFDRKVESVSFQFLRRPDPLRPLHLADALQHHAFGNLDPDILPALGVKGQRSLLLVAEVAAILRLARRHLLSLEDVADGLRGLRLKRLLSELEFHKNLTSVGASLPQTALKISRALIFAALSLKSTSRKMANCGLRIASFLTNASVMPVSKHASICPPSTEKTVLPSTVSSSIGQSIDSPHSNRVEIRRSSPVRPSLTLFTMPGSIACVTSVGE